MRGEGTGGLQQGEQTTKGPPRAGHEKSNKSELYDMGDGEKSQVLNIQTPRNKGYQQGKEISNTVPEKEAKA